MILKHSNVSAANENMADFCKRNLMLRFLNAQNKAPTEAGAWPLPKLEKYVDDVVSNLVDGDMLGAWDLALISTEKSRKNISATLQKDSSRIEKMYRTESSAEPIPSLETTLSKKAPTEVPKSTADMIASLEARPSIKKVSEVFSLKNKIGGCLVENTISFLQCKKGLDFVEKTNQLVATVGQTKILFTVFQLWKKFYSTAKYNEGLRIAALKLQSRAKGNVEARSNAFEDIFDSFVQSGMNAKDATEATWDTFGLISNGGQNTAQRAYAIEASQKSASLSVIASSFSYIDMVKAKAGLPLYSYPSNVKTTCDNGKPYHFWMSAYLARGMVTEEKIEPKIAADTVFTIQKGYQLQGRDLLRGKIPANVILTREPFDPAHQIVRTDLAFSMAGAEFGAQSAKQTSAKEINVNESIVSLIQNAGVNKPLTKEEAAGLSLPSSYLHWNQIFLQIRQKKELAIRVPRGIRSIIFFGLLYQEEKI